MNFADIRKSLLVTSILAAAGGTAVFVEPAFAGPVAAGSYDLVILTTPVYTSAKGKTSFAFGSDGAWNSTFTVNNAPSASSQGMTDNGVNLVRLDGSSFGSSVAGDGYAGVLGLSVDSLGNITVSAFGKDSVLDTLFGTFAQETDAAELGFMSGNINLGTGAMTLVTGDFLTALGREGGGGGGSPIYECHSCDVPWNKDDVGLSQEYATFRTGSAATDTNSINGAVLTGIGDVNGDGVDDYRAVLVSGGDVGSLWGPAVGYDYFEVWSVQLLSQSDAAVPVPAALWLFGSGLLGLMGAARRKRK